MTVRRSILEYEKKLEALIANAEREVDAARQVLALAEAKLHGLRGALDLASAPGLGDGRRRRKAQADPDIEKT